MNDLMAFLLMRQRLASFFPSYSAPEAEEEDRATEEEDEEPSPSSSRLAGDVMDGISMPDYQTRRADDAFWTPFFEHMNQVFPVVFQPPVQRPQEVIESEESEPNDVFNPVYRARRQAQLASALGRGRRI